MIWQAVLPALIATIAFSFYLTSTEAPREFLASWENMIATRHKSRIPSPLTHYAIRSPYPKSLAALIAGTDRRKKSCHAAAEHSFFT
jgi:hypothetical protein